MNKIKLFYKSDDINTMKILNTMKNIANILNNEGIKHKKEYFIIMCPKINKNNESGQKLKIYCYNDKYNDILTLINDKMNFVNII